MQAITTGLFLQGHMKDGTFLWNKISQDFIFQPSE